jgi:hypothetical protein
VVSDEVGDLLVAPARLRGVRRDRQVVLRQAPPVAAAVRPRARELGDVEQQRLEAVLVDARVARDDVGQRAAGADVAGRVSTDDVAGGGAAGSASSSRV